MNKIDVKIGQICFFYYRKYKTYVSGKIIKKNPKTVRIQLDAASTKKIKYKTTIANPIFVVSYNLLLEKPTISTMASEIGIAPRPSGSNLSSNLKLMSQVALDSILRKTKNEFNTIFQKLFTPHEKILLSKVSISWGKHRTYRQAGKYQIKPNHIQISASLKGTTVTVIKSVIYHELLHIHFHEHGPLFRRYEALDPNLKRSNTFISELFLSIRNSS